MLRGKQDALPVQAAIPGAQLADTIGWGGKEGTQDRQARSKESLTDAAVSIWKRATSRLFDLEAKIVTQVPFHRAALEEALIIQPKDLRGCLLRHLPYL